MPGYPACFIFNGMSTAATVTVQIPSHMMITGDGRTVATPRLRNGLVDSDAVRRLRGTVLGLVAIPL